MALTVSATDVELPKPVNNMFVQSFLRNARPRAPYFIGTVPAELIRHGGTSTVKWHRIENLAPVTTPLTELTSTAQYMQGRDAAALSTSTVTASVQKYGSYVILNEEVDIFDPAGQMGKIMEVIGINAGRSLNQLQRDVAEDNLSIVRAGGVAADNLIASAISLSAIKLVINTLDRNSAVTFSPMTTGTQNVGTVPVLPAYWGICHPDVAVDVAGLSGFKSVEQYAGQVGTVAGEFGLLQVAGKAVRFISSEDAGVDANAGAAIGTTGLNGTTNVDLYTTVIYGMDCLGSVGFDTTFPSSTFEVGDSMSAIDIIIQPLGSGGTSDPYREIQTVAWKAFHAGAVLNSSWGRAIRSGATKLTA